MVLRLRGDTKLHEDGLTLPGGNIQKDSSLSLVLCLRGAMHALLHATGSAYDQILLKRPTK
eukprot:11403166-Prorocentrum_lima.AAC.1